jgi:hypothetical protein
MEWINPAKLRTFLASQGLQAPTAQSSVQALAIPVKHKSSDSRDSFSIKDEPHNVRIFQPPVPAVRTHTI